MLKFSYGKFRVLKVTNLRINKPISHFNKINNQNTTMLMKTDLMTTLFDKTQQLQTTTIIYYTSKENLLL